MARSNKRPTCWKGRAVTAGRSSCRMADSCSSPWDLLTSVLCISAPRPTRTCNEYPIENPATGSCRPLMCCSHAKGLCGRAGWAAIPPLSRESWSLLPRRFSCPQDSSATARSPRQQPGPSPTARRPAKRSLSGSIELAVLSVALDRRTMAKRLCISCRVMGAPLRSRARSRGTRTSGSSIPNGAHPAD